MGKISKWILNSFAVGVIQAQDFEVTNCEDANVSLIWRIRVTESNYIAQYFFWHIKSFFHNLKLSRTNIFRVIPPYLWDSRSNTLMLTSMLTKMISLWIMGTMRRHLRELLSIWFMMTLMMVSDEILELIFVFECSNKNLRIDSELYPWYTPDATYCPQW